MLNLSFETTCITWSVTFITVDLSVFQWAQLPRLDGASGSSH